MIYTVIARTDILSKYFGLWDCSSEQPLNLIKKSEEESIISPDIVKYINETGNEKTKKERISAYTSLFFSLYTIFNVKPNEILRTEFSKPYIREKVFFSISHADELTVVSISDVTEIGVDIQGLISEERGRKIEDRFLSDFEYLEENFDVSYLYLTVDGEGKLRFLPLTEDFDMSIINGAYKQTQNNCETIENEILTLSEDENLDLTHYTKIWTAAEAMSKLHGGGLSDFKRINEIAKSSLCRHNCIKLFNETYILTNAIYRKTQFYK
jgi:phosphopantetheinyl transferase